MSTNTASQLLLSFYGDDFTGSTDAMEVLEWAGIPTLLFLAPPSTELLETRFQHIRAVGVAGVSRSMTPSQMDDKLPPIFSAIKSLNSHIVHYKVCSTFDSSPTDWQHRPRNRDRPANFRRTNGTTGRGCTVPAALRGVQQFVCTRRRYDLPAGSSSDDEQTPRDTDG
jgi:hypothetical protein